MRTRSTKPATFFSFDGVDIHSGAPARATLHASDAGTGIAFLRSGLAGGHERLIPARLGNVVSSELQTRLAVPDASEASVGTVEHILAALAAAGIHDALIEVDGPAVPILDGSAAPFLAACASLRQSATSWAAPAIEIIAPLRVALGASFAEFVPASGGLTLDIAIDYPCPVIGRQRRVTRLSPASFAREIARARTFGFVTDAERLWREGFARAADFGNTIVIDGERVLNPGGLRFPDEFVRHKTLDAIGDLSLAGAPIRGLFRSFRGGHSLNRLAVQTLLETPSTWRWRTGRSQRPTHVPSDVYVPSR